MNGLMNLLIGYFSVFFEMMFFIPTRFQIWYWSEAVILIFILAVGMGVIFLCDWLMRKYNLGFPASILLAFFILSLALGLTGLFLSIPRLDLNPLAPFLIVGLGSPLCNLVLGVAATMGNRLSNNHPIAGALLLCGTGFLFAYVWFTTFAVFFLSLYNY